MPTLAEVLLTARERAGLSQEELAKRIGVTRATVSQWERGGAGPKRSRARAVAEALGIPLTAIDPFAGNRPESVDIHQRSRTICVYGWSLTWSSSGGVELERGGAKIAVDDGLPIEIIALVVADEAMAPDYKAGDIIIIDPNVLPRPGEAVVVAVHGQDAAVLRAYHPRGLDSAGEPAFDLRATNPDFATVTINSRHPAKIVGTVIESRRKRRV